MYQSRSLPSALSFVVNVHLDPFLLCAIKVSTPFWGNHREESPFTSGLIHPTSSSCQHLEQMEWYRLAFNLRERSRTGWTGCPGRRPWAHALRRRVGPGPTVDVYLDPRAGSGQFPCGCKWLSCGPGNTQLKETVNVFLLTSSNKMVHRVWQYFFLFNMALVHLPLITPEIVESTSNFWPAYIQPGQASWKESGGGGLVSGHWGRQTQQRNRERMRRRSTHWIHSTVPKAASVIPVFK